jgi:hypothetical protein
MNNFIFRYVHPLDCIRNLSRPLSARQGGGLSFAVGLVVFVLLLALPISTIAASSPIPLEAQIYSTMPSTTAHSPVMAMDGSLDTYFKSVYEMGDGDDFIVLLSRPIKVNSIEVVTGDPDGNDLLTNGTLDTSSDQKSYGPTASFNADGTATDDLKGKQVMSIRVRLHHGQSIPHLIIREITIDSSEAVTRVDIGPGRGFVDYSHAPEVAAWAARAEAQMESFWPDTAALLYTPGFITPNAVNVIYNGPESSGIAATGGGVMSVNSAWCDAHPDDTGLTVHETAHVIQAFESYDPVWLIEGEADYIRWVKFEPQNFRPSIDVRTATYHDAYQTTAAFLGWCENHYDNTLVTQLNRAVRAGAYTNNLFAQYCGKDVDALWAEFVNEYKADPADILPADGNTARPLPTAAPGTSVPVDISKLYNTVGITLDGTAASPESGLDGEGATYSGTVLAAETTCRNVQFSLGPASVPNTIACARDVVLLPTGNYSSVWMLGTSVNGASLDQTFVVAYTDGTTQTFAQNLSDWNDPGEFEGETTAVRAPYRNLYDGSKDARTFNLYCYGFCINPAKTVKSITLPDNKSVKLLAISLAGKAAVH